MFFTTVDVFVCAIRSFPMLNMIVMIASALYMIRVLTWIAIALCFIGLSLLEFVEKLPLTRFRRLGLGERHPLTERKQLTIRSQDSGVSVNRLMLSKSSSYLKYD